jgi:hypothetical protein
MLPHAMECFILHDRLRIVTSKGGQSFLASRQYANILNFFPQQNRKTVDCITSFLKSAGVWLNYCGGLYLFLYCTYSLWLKFNCVKIPQCEANKSANSWGSFGAKGGVVPPSVFNQLSKCLD